MKKRNKFTIDYFIKKFQKIPSSEIGKGKLADHCAMWHVGIKELRSDYVAKTVEAKAFVKIFGNFENIYNTNDRERNFNGIHLTGRTPKERILRALKMIKSKKIIVKY